MKNLILCLRDEENVMLLQANAEMLNDWIFNDIIISIIVVFC